MSSASGDDVGLERCGRCSTSDERPQLKNAPYAGKFSEKGPSPSTGEVTTTCLQKRPVCFPGLTVETKSRTDSGRPRGKNVRLPQLVLTEYIEQTVCDERAIPARSVTEARGEQARIVQKTASGPGFIRLSDVDGGNVRHISRTDVQPMATVLEICPLENVTIYACCSFAQVMVEGLVDAKLYLGAVSGPVYFQRCERCRVRIAAAQQVRFTDCADMHVRLRCLTRPVMETSQRLVFESMSCESEDAYPEEVDDLALFSTQMRLPQTTWFDSATQPPVAFGTILTTNAYHADAMPRPEFTL